MSISESLHYYESGRLIELKDNKLQTGITILSNKINYVEMVIKEGGATPDLHADVRKYQNCLDEMQRLSGNRARIAHFVF